MKKKEKRKDDVLAMWSALTAEEKESALSSVKPFVRKWLDIPDAKKTIIEYSALIVLLLLSLLLANSEGMLIKTAALGLFLIDWALFMFTEKCRKNGVDTVEGILAYGYFNSSKVSKTTET